MSCVLPLRVLVVDDHVGIRTGIASLVDAEAPRMQAVGMAATASEALLLASELLPDVIVLDVDLGGEDGLALIPALHRLLRCEVVVLTSLADPQIAMHARRLGARACLHKTAPAAELMACIGSLAAEDSDLAPLAAHPSNVGVGLSHELGNKHPWVEVGSADA